MAQMEGSSQSKPRCGSLTGAWWHLQIKGHILPLCLAGGWGGAPWRTQARILGHTQAERQNLGRAEAQNEGGGRRKVLGLEVKARTRLSEQPLS